MTTPGRWLPHTLAPILIGGSLAVAQTEVGAGIIEGQVVYEGEVPRPTIVIEGGRTQPVLYVDKSGGLRYAVAFLSGARAAMPADEAPATLNQVGFVYEPQVLAVREGQTVRLANEDGANHNVRAEHGIPTNRFSIYTGAGQVGTHHFRATGDRPALITCDIHPWMTAWVYAFAHPYYAVTDETGRFRIAGLPVGRHQLVVHQPAGGLRRRVSVDVAEQGVARVTVHFVASDLRLASAVPVN